MLRRRQTLRRVALHELLPRTRRAGENRPHIQHLRPENGHQRRPRGFEFHRAGAARRADHHLRQRRADPQFPVYRRPDRGNAPHDDRNARRLHGAGQYRQPERIHDLRAGAHRPRTHRLQIENHPHAPAVGRPAAAQTRHHPRPQDARRLGTDDPAGSADPPVPPTLRSGRFRRSFLLSRRTAIPSDNRGAPLLPAAPASASDAVRQIR